MRLPTRCMPIFLLAPLAMISTARSLISPYIRHRRRRSTCSWHIPTVTATLTEEPSVKKTATTAPPLPIKIIKIILMILP
ncbi:hypothetical protein BDB00DRAFT_795123 [Zychaea mexicana]|uniref:uncharacterized protein n=1 Tax=Zychaea mexicana TaxID=64656 RepID=UPI0022FE419F|nr:uncharacterized protein BDB00DRAFT_795123 [Zychaea mexicana]KAI9499686.1 hypothetical protein BDB00DRAFT_795123 [Zychaea mexicana]